MRLYEMNNIFEWLKNYQNIAIDVDNTLIGESPNKEKLWKWIAENWDKHNLYIVTFRYRGGLFYVWSDILEETTEIKKSMFKGIFGVPDEIGIAYYKLEDLLSLSSEDRERKIEKYGIDLQDLKEKAAPFYYWKGKKCHELGCKVLIDDDTEKTKPGTDKYSITLIHPDKL